MCIRCIKRTNELYDIVRFERNTKTYNLSERIMRLMNDFIPEFYESINNIYLSRRIIPLYGHCQHEMRCTNTIIFFHDFNINLKLLYPDEVLVFMKILIQCMCTNARQACILLVLCFCDFNKTFREFCGRFMQQTLIQVQYFGFGVSLHCVFGYS